MIYSASRWCIDLMTLITSCVAKYVFFCNSCGCFLTSTSWSDPNNLIFIPWSAPLPEKACPKMCIMLYLPEVYTKCDWASFEYQLGGFCCKTPGNPDPGSSLILSLCRRRFTNACLDNICGYLVELQSLSPNAALQDIIRNFKCLQAKLEKLHWWRWFCSDTTAAWRLSAHQDSVFIFTDNLHSCSHGNNPIDGWN